MFGLTSAKMKSVGRAWLEKVEHVFLPRHVITLIGDRFVAHKMDYYTTNLIGGISQKLGDFSPKCVGQIMLAIEHGKCYGLECRRESDGLYQMIYDGQPIGYVVTHLGIAVGVTADEAMEYYRRQALTLVKPIAGIHANFSADLSPFIDAVNKARMSIDQFKAALYNRPLP